MKRSSITITDIAPDVTTIDIEGTIGVPEEWQFDDPAGRVATYEKFSRTLAAISSIRSAEIIVNIRSTGGDVGDALMIYDALCESGARITTRCRGYVASAATVIAQAASEGGREVSANSLYLIHNSASSCEGNALELSRNVELLNRTDQRLAAIYARHSGRSEADFLALMSENNGTGRWLSPEETLVEGLADVITTDKAPAGKRSGRLVGNSATADALRLGADLSLEEIATAAAIERLAAGQNDACPMPLETREDPSPAEIRRSANEIAYRRDIEAFTNH